MNSKRTFAHFATAIALTLGMYQAADSRAQELAIKDGQKIAFLGDSITQQGAGSPSGYVRLVISGLEANGIKAVAIGAGISGHKSNQMLERLEKDVLSKKPEWMTLSCGVNDVWHGEKGVPLEQYKVNITEIVTRSQAAGVKVVILTSTMIGEDQPNANNQKLIPYNEFLRGLATEKQCPLADLNADMQAAIQAAGANHKGNLLTADGVHMNPAGNQMMATGVLKALGLTAAQLEKAQAFWLTIPEACEMVGKAKVTIRQYRQLDALAAERKCSAADLVNQELGKALNGLLEKAPGK